MPKSRKQRMQDLLRPFSLTRKDLRRGKRRVNPTGLWLMVLAVLSLLIFFAEQRLRTTVKDIRRSEIESQLETNARTLELWIDEFEREVGFVSRIPRMRQLALELLQARQSLDADSLLATHPVQDSLQALIAELHGRLPLSAFMVIATDGTLLASAQPVNVGARFNKPVVESFVPNAFAGETSFLIPQAGVEWFEVPLKAGSGQANVWAFSGIPDRSGRVVALLGLAREAKQEFSDIFRVGQLGRTGESYAVGTLGEMLSESRFLPALQASRWGQEHPNLLQEGFRVANPGADLMKGKLPSKARPDLPLTQAADAMVQRAKDSTGAVSGVFLKPYPDYRGIPVIGGWIYLPQHKMGILAEQDAVEAYEALIYLQVPFYLTLLVALVLVAINVVSGLTIRRLRKASLEDRQIGYYRVGKQIGKGGMGEVYRAEHALLKRPTALKILRRGIDGDEDHLRSFQREVTLAARLEHPNTISIFDYGLTPEGDFFYTMELLEGRTLEEITRKEGKQPPARVAHVLRQVAGSLAEAHQNGLVHSDIKPANVMLCRRAGMEDVAKVLDFGLVTHLGNLDDAPSRTRLRGTIRYMAPERITRPGSTSFAVDIYGLGILGYTLLTGHDPFLEDEEVDMTTQVLNIDPYPAAVDEEAQGLMRVLRTCLQKDPSVRFTSARAFLVALDALDLPAWNPEGVVQESPSGKPMVKVVAQGQWLGPRKDQQDRMLIHEAAGITALADGMGGKPGGGVAAQLVMDELSRLEKGSGQREVEEAVARALQAMEQHARQNPDCQKMGTTLLVYGCEEGGKLCWSGDSRAYVLEKGSYPQRVTQDHSQGGLLTKWVGLQSGVGILEWKDLRVEHKQRLLLASDGFYKAWEAAGFPPVEDKKVQKQLSGQFQDNATFILLELQYI